MMADDTERPTLGDVKAFAALGLARTTPRPWRTGTADRRCVKQHKHEGAPTCEYTMQGWNDGPDYFGRFISAADGTEIIGSDDYGPVLSLDDARLIVAAVNAFAP